MPVNNAPTSADIYKFFHSFAYLETTRYIYANYTNRFGKYSNVENGGLVACVGIQGFCIDYLINEWNDSFFNVPKEEAIGNLKKLVTDAIQHQYPMTHFEELHDLGYMPLHIKALPEGVMVPYNVANVTFINTHSKFPWMTNFVESVFSCENWPIQTACTTAHAIYQAFIDECEGIIPEDVYSHLGHDYSMRGLMFRQATQGVGFGHLAAGFKGTDSLSAIAYAEKFYGADNTNGNVGTSVYATEHSTATTAILTLCARHYGLTKLKAEAMYIEYLLDTVGDDADLAYVADSFDFWGVITKVLPTLKDRLLARKGKFIVRPDTGNPVEVVCGIPNCIKVDGVYYRSVDDVALGNPIPDCEVYGLYEMMVNIFGTTLVNGYYALPENIGIVYGDSITPVVQRKMLRGLKGKGFAPTVALGVGSYTYQYVTRDTHGSAIKTTWAVDYELGEDGLPSNVIEVDVCKDPKTDKLKKSACGLLRVEFEDGEYVQYDKQTKEQEKSGCLQDVFVNGLLYNLTTLDEIRERQQAFYKRK